MNEAFTIKLGWELIQNPSTLWAQGMLGEYDTGIDMRQDIICRNTDSTLWKRLSEAWPTILDHMLFIVSDEESTPFWNKAQLQKGRMLAEQVYTQLSPEEKSQVVSHYINNEGEWDRECLAPYLSEELMNLITISLPFKSEDGPNTIVWDASSNGVFTIKNCYSLLRNQNMTPIRVLNHIWKWICGSLPLTASQIAKWGRGDNPICSHCNAEIKTPIHAIRDCPETARIWI